MTFDERLAALGVETNDILPSNEHCNNLYEKFFALTERICKEMGEECDLEMLLSFLLIAIAKRDEIIDRMETRIVNLTVECDWLRYDECPTCVNHDKHNPLLCGIDDDCMQDNDGYCTHYVYSGVPEDWRAHDD